MSTLPFCYSFLLPHPTGKNRARPSAALTERGKKALWRRAPPPPARGRSRRVCRRIHESTTGRPPCHPRPASFARGRRRRPPGPARATGVGPARQQAAPSRAHPGLCSGHRGLSSGAEEEPGAADLSSDTEGQPGADGASSCSRRKVLHSLCKKQCTSNRSSWIYSSVRFTVHLIS